MEKFISYLLPTILCGSIVAGKNVLVDNYMLNDVHVWIDTGANMFEFMSSKLITEMMLDVENDFALLMEPALHALFNGVVKEFMVNRDSIRGLQYYGVKRLGKLPPVEHYTFMNGVQDGLIYNTFSNYLYLPFKNMI